MWMAIPLGINSVSPGAKSTARLIQAFKSMPAEPSV
ncbi:uncharacterized protein METZ01_LOCUS134247 [marine metagenome]|uniref:Uncharacterized protein n=1 Tax=marine metagenome TaxID=408172 RepID=A0A381YXU1_9ZZZZ